VYNYVGKNQLQIPLKNRFPIFLNDFPFQNSKMSRIFLWVLLLTGINAFSQQTAIYFEPEHTYRSALDLFDKQKYGAAQKEFEKVINSRDNVSYTTRANSVYYAGKCAAELFNKDAEYLLINFLENYPANPNYNSAQFDLALYYYRLKRYKNSIEWFEKIDQSQLQAEQKDEINFKLGYAYYMTNNYEKASKAFYAMKDGNSKYATAAQYYYGHIAYVNENYETALNSFMKLKDSESFGAVVPYYIAQIYYKQRKFDEVLKYATGIHDTTNSKNGLEIGRMIGESYYRNEKYKEALPYLLDYDKNSAAADRTDWYSIAFSYYKLGDYDNAIRYFQKVVTEDDSLGQNGFFHLADCFLHTGNKRSARTAFQSAGKLSLDPYIQEESQFNYAKLSYELNFQSVAIQAFREFIRTYPQSANVDKANEMLIDIYANTHNYKDAITELDAIKNKSQNLKTAYQRVTYFRGIELFMDGKYDDSEKMFQLSLTNPVDQRITAETNYWLGESYYRQADYEEAIHYYSDFLVTPGSMRNKKYNNANYNVGYALFKQGKYQDAIFAFRNFIEAKSDVARTNDALLRLGDCYFMTNDLASASDYYNRAFSNKTKAGDYALYQKGMISGVQGRMSEKISSMQKLMDNYPKSVYFDDAMYEAGQASLISNNFDKSLAYFRKLISDYPNSTYQLKAQVGEAQALYNLNEDEKALTAFKNIRKKYPNTEESNQSLEQIEKIYVSKHDVPGYVEYAKSSGANLSTSAEDSLTYHAAEVFYTQGNCEKAVQEFNSYLQRFPNAIFALNANYYKSDCLYRDKKYAEALPGYEYVLTQPAGIYTENSIHNAAVAHYELKQYDKAIVDYQNLEKVAKNKSNIVEAIEGQLYSSYYLGDCDVAVDAAKKVIESDLTNNELQNKARIIAGRCYVKQENFADAKKVFALVAKTKSGEAVAESKYWLAFIEYKMSNYKEAQSTALEIQKMTPSYDYWIAKGFILIGDIYVAQKDTFQAKMTYKSILQNYKKDPSDPDDLKQIAADKMNAISPAIAPKNESVIPPDSTEIPPK
jgi:TolA-binding protein